MLHLAFMRTAFTAWSLAQISACCGMFAFTRVLWFGTSTLQVLPPSLRTAPTLLWSTLLRPVLRALIRPALLLPALTGKHNTTLTNTALTDVQVGAHDHEAEQRGEVEKVPCALQMPPPALPQCQHIVSRVEQDGNNQEGLS